MKRTALKRKTPIRRKRKTPRRSARQRDTEYMLRVKQLPCCARWLASGPPEGCSGPIHAHHAGERAAGRKADDDTCIPLCQQHHQNWHDANGVFLLWDKTERRIWADYKITQTRIALRHPHTQVEPCPF